MNKNTILFVYLPKTPKQPDSLYDESILLSRPVFWVSVNLRIYILDITNQLLTDLWDPTIYIWEVQFFSISYDAQPQSGSMVRFQWLYWQV